MNLVVQKILYTLKIRKRIKTIDLEIIDILATHFHVGREQTFDELYNRFELIKRYGG